MKQYHKNPRRITDDDLADLRRWLVELGDLSGIVHDLNSDEIIGGNQRGRVFDINSAVIEMVDGPHEPDEQGTVAHGFVVWQGKRYAYRQVRWTPRQCEKANIVANQAGGDWDAVILASEFQAADLVEWGFEKDELEELLASVQSGEAAVQAMLAELAEGAGLYQPVDGIDPSLIPEGDRYKEQYGVIIICADGREQQTVYEALTAEGYKCRVVVT